MRITLWRERGYWCWKDENDGGSSIQAGGFPSLLDAVLDLIRHICYDPTRRGI